MFIISEQGTPTNFSSAEKEKEAQPNLPLAMDQLLGKGLAVTADVSDLCINASALDKREYWMIIFLISLGNHML